MFEQRMPTCFIDEQQHSIQLIWKKWNQINETIATTVTSIIDDNNSSMQSSYSERSKAAKRTIQNTITQKMSKNKSDFRVSFSKKRNQSCFLTKSKQSAINEWFSIIFLTVLNLLTRSIVIGVEKINDAKNVVARNDRRRRRKKVKEKELTNAKKDRWEMKKHIRFYAQCVFEQHFLFLL